MLSVGGLAALVNVIVLVVVAFVDRVVEVIVRNFAAARLRSTHSSPVIHDSDTWILNIPRSLFKYRRHPAILLTVLVSVLLISSEVITEIGVDVSHKCGPVVKTGTVIVAGDVSGRVTIVERGASAFFVQNLTFFDGDIERIPAGLPRRLTGSECLKCMDKHRDKYPDIMRECSVSTAKVYRPKQLEIGIKSSTSSAFGNITVGFREVSGGKSYMGSGDITNNGQFFTAFVVDSITSQTTLYLEYSNHPHIQELVNRARTDQDNVVWDDVRTDVEVLIVSCKVNQISKIYFEEALQVYRTVTLENTVNPLPYDEKKKRFEQLNNQDIYKAGLSVKVIDDRHSDGAYYSYVSCGVYNPKYFLPMAISLLILLILGIFSVQCSEGNMRSIPFSSRTWFEHSQQVGFNDNMDIEDGIQKRGFLEEYTAGMSDEMIILEFGEDANMIRPHIALKCKSKRKGERVSLRFFNFKSRRNNKGDLENGYENESKAESATTET